MTREITQYRKEIDPLRTENAVIPELKLRVQALEKALSEKQSRNSNFATVPDTPSGDDNSQSQEEITRLRLALAHQKAVETHLCQELVTLRGTIGQHELSCKKIISACCNVPLQQVDEILQPLLDALESDDFNLDMRLVTGVMSRIRAENVANVPPSENGLSDFSDGSNGYYM